MCSSDLFPSHDTLLGVDIVMAGRSCEGLREYSLKSLSMRRMCSCSAFPLIPRDFSFADFPAAIACRALSSQYTPGFISVRLVFIPVSHNPKPSTFVSTVGISGCGSLK